MTTATHEYERFIEPIEDKMMGCVWRVTRDADAAEEAFQEALAVIWRRWDRIRRHPNPEALILRICINSSYDVLRKEIRRRKREVETDFVGPSPIPQPADAVAAQERESTILQAISRLSRNQSVAVIMRLVQGCTYSDIAHALGCRDATARKHVERGRERLRGMLAPLMGGPADEEVL
ncbi:MAG TPA: RNA polymerase sigma factor [Candidatus Hydrogenedentes bacterium]|nr:RNA polymerase sigma factor [Candidatus Hydrogenedentota bacterium]HPG69543.1 RNA polymerase sigma factor [Candidatus Hydrogenedentota bacterium]